MPRNYRQKSVMQHQFSQVPRAEIPRSTFDRSHGHKTTFSAGTLVPVLVDEALPGDTFSLNMTAFARMATPIFPIMDNLFLDSFFFAVPYRLVWQNWEKFNGAQDNPGDSTDFLIPELADNPTGFTALSPADYMGLPVGVPIGPNALPVSALPFRAMLLTWNQWFRDQNMQDSIPVPLGDGPDPHAPYNALLRRGKRHDYFTSCLPWPQKGPGVMIPLGTVAPVRTAAIDTIAPGVQNPLLWSNASAGIPVSAGDLGVGGGGETVMGGVAPGSLSVVPRNLYADLSLASAATINSLRQAFQIQKIYERDARGGTRYVEVIKAHWGVTSPDFRHQRSEFLGGGSTPINITPIPQTSASGAYADSPQGNLAAMGTALASNHGFTMSFTEHCIILGFVSIRADLTYQQGINRMFSRRTRFDHYWPALAHIGEQAVLQKEIFASGVPAEDNLVFGYQERAAEYRYKPSMVTGQFRSSHPTPLDAWHLAQDFAAAPVLNDTFIVENPPVDRVVAVPSEPHFLCDMYFRMHCARPMPLYGVPGLMDHF